jgi:hypothetical protein
MSLTRDELSVVASFLSFRELLLQSSISSIINKIFQKESKSRNIELTFLSTFKKPTKDCAMILVNEMHHSVVVEEIHAENNTDYLQCYLSPVILQYLRNGNLYEFCFDEPYIYILRSLTNIPKAENTAIQRKVNLLWNTNVKTNHNKVFNCKLDIFEGKISIFKCDLQ